MVADPPRAVSGSILPTGMLDKVVASFLVSTAGAGGAGLMGFVFKGPEGSSSRRCLFQTLTCGGPPFSGVSVRSRPCLPSLKWVGQRAPARPSPDYASKVAIALIL